MGDCAPASGVGLPCAPDVRTRRAPCRPARPRSRQRALDGGLSRLEPALTTRRALFLFLAHHHAHVVHGLDLGDGDCAAVERRAVSSHAQDAVRDAVAILHADAILGARRAVGHLEALPRARDALDDVQRAVLDAQPEDRRDADAIHPRRGAGAQVQPPRPVCGGCE